MYPVDFEVRDWAYGEDQSVDLEPIRKTYEDDIGGLYTYHESDNRKSANSTPHEIGHALAVAFMLLSLDDTYLSDYDNPVCANQSLSGCDQNLESLGTQKAMEIFLRMISTHLQPTTEWEDLANLTKFSAHELYRNPSTGYNALDVQRAIQKAFWAIGYGGTMPTKGYCSYPYPDFCDIPFISK